MSRICRAVAMIVISIAWAASAWAAEPKAQHKSADPYGLYGNCWEGTPFNDSVFLNKAGHVFAIDRGSTLSKVAGIVVIGCRHWDGAGGSFVHSCPAGSPYSYCIENQNDGAGNHIDLGVVELNRKTDPNRYYGGCAPGATARSKSSIVLQAVDTIRDVNSIIVTGCRAADGPAGTVKVPCPNGSIYDACYVNADDGAGNHVEFGVLNSFGPSDPVGQYGSFSETSTGKYRSKSAIVTDVGRSLSKVIGITILWAGEDSGGGTRMVPCPMPYSYCVQTSGDETGDSVIVGVTLRP